MKIKDIIYTDCLIPVNNIKTFTWLSYEPTMIEVLEVAHGLRPEYHLDAIYLMPKK